MNKAKKATLFTLMLIDQSMKAAISITRDMVKASWLIIMEISTFVIGLEIVE